MTTSTYFLPWRRPLAVLLIGAALLLAACGGEPTPQPTPEVSLPNVKIESGAMALPGTSGAEEPGAAAPAGDAPDAAATAAPAPADAAVPAPAGPVYRVGEQVIAADALRVYAEPDTKATQYGTYPGGATLTVVEPSDDFAGYPVQVDGQEWYRVRFPDGLVGWVQAVVITAQ